MTTWILAVLLLYVVQIYFSALFLLPAAGVMRLAGGRDNLPDRGVYAGRAERALVNLKENLPIFLALAVLAYVAPGANMELAILGAQVFFIGRLAYVPLYLSGIPFLRSTAYGVGFVGNVVMAWALMGS